MSSLAEATKGLALALNNADTAKRCIAGNRGHDRELALESYDHQVSELIDAMVEVLGSGELIPGDVQEIGSVMFRRAQKALVRQEGQ